jgi:hypothetical protein
MKKEAPPIMPYRISRRQLVTHALGVAAAGKAPPGVAGTPEATPAVIVSVRDDPAARGFDRRDFGIVGVYDVDWLGSDAFAHLLNNLAASPGAFHGGRFFGAFTAGKTELYTPEDGGTVWVDADDRIDFATTFRALEALVTRGLMPFVVLGMFPPAISDSPIRPPREWDRWKQLVRTFLEELMADPRFGPAAIGSWWFEAWNEPNEERFWSGSFDDYLALYRATSEAVAETARWSRDRLQTAGEPRLRRAVDGAVSPLRRVGSVPSPRLHLAASKGHGRR